MVRHLTLIAFLVGATAALAGSDEFDDERFIAAQRVIENFNGRDGAAGERGPYQVREVTWCQHMPGLPFTEARKEEQGRICALRHVRWLRARLRAAGCSDDAFMISLAYNAGLGRVLTGKAPVRAYQQAGRVVNIYRQ